MTPPRNTWAGWVTLATVPLCVRRGAGWAGDLAVGVVSGYMLDLGMDDPLAMTDEEVARLTGPQRVERVHALVQQARDIFSAGIEQHVTHQGRMVAAVVGLFSGGRDSTTLVHIFRDVLDYAAHANTGIGIERTRQFVRDTCDEWNLALLERRAPNEKDHYETLVLTNQRGKNGEALGGFPGPALHWKTFTRLKERAFRVIQAETVTNPRKERVVFLAGRRRPESKRRQAIPEHDPRGPVLWISPLVNWTKLDLNTYALMHAPDQGGACRLCGCSGVPVNYASSVIHMSGECLCGSMASAGEREQIAYWFPLDFEQIAKLERLLADRDDIPEHRKKWGWGADPVAKAADKEYLAQFNAEPEEEEESTAPSLCMSCDGRYQAALDFGGAA